MKVGTRHLFSYLCLVRSSVIYGAIVVNNNHLDHAFAAVMAISDCYLCLGSFKLHTYQLRPPVRQKIFSFRKVSKIFQGFILFVCWFWQILQLLYFSPRIRFMIRAEFDIASMVHSLIVSLHFVAYMFRDFRPKDRTECNFECLKYCDATISLV